MTRIEFYLRVSRNLKNAGYYSAVIGNQLRAYGADNIVVVSFKRNVVTIDGNETNWNHHFIDNMVVISSNEIIAKLFLSVASLQHDSEAEKVKLLNASYLREKFRELTQFEYSYYVGYFNREAEKDSNGQESYYPYAYDMESDEIVVEYDSPFECCNRLFTKVSGLYD